jgi:hypothetical protein
MIQLKDLDLEMTEVLDGELGSVVGGSDFGFGGFSSSNYSSPMSLGTSLQDFMTPSTSSTVGLSYNGNIKNDGWTGLGVKYTSGASSYNANLSGTMGFSTPTGNSSSVEASYNPWSGNMSANWNWKLQ